MVREILEIICVAIVTNFVTWQVSWRLGVKNGKKWEKYRHDADLKITTVKERNQ